MSISFANEVFFNSEVNNIWQEHFTDFFRRRIIRYHRTKGRKQRSDLATCWAAFSLLVIEEKEYSKIVGEIRKKLTSLGCSIWAIEEIFPIDGDIAEEHSAILTQIFNREN